MIDCDGEGTYEVVRKTCDSGNEDSGTGQRAHTASWPDSSAGANLISIDAYLDAHWHILKYPGNKNVYVDRIGCS